MSDVNEGEESSARMASTSSGIQPPSTDQQHYVYHCSCTAAVQSGWSCEDDPPPYASLVDSDYQHSHNHNHRHQPPRLPWSYVFQRCDGSPDNNRTIARPLVAIPLTSYGIFKIEPPSYNVATGQQQQQSRIVPELGPSAVKSSASRGRKYSAILIAATVIIFLMALSLMVRLVTEKSFWRG